MSLLHNNGLYKINVKFSVYLESYIMLLNFIFLFSRSNYIKLKKSVFYRIY